MKWVAVFSQSGQEIATLSKKMGREPDLLVTNNHNPETYHPDLIELRKRVPMLMAKHDRLMEFFRLQVDAIKEPDVVTLHGYLRIIPADICEMYFIVNGHPGLITRFPELKGKDPQEKVAAFPNLYTDSQNNLVLGSVVHRCTSELDGGAIFSSSTSYVAAPNWVGLNYDEMRELVYNQLRRTSTEAWSYFMMDLFKDENRDNWSTVGR